MLARISTEIDRQAEIENHSCVSSGEAAKGRDSRLETGVTRSVYKVDDLERLQACLQGFPLKLTARRKSRIIAASAAEKPRRGGIRDWRLGLREA